MVISSNPSIKSQNEQVPTKLIKPNQVTIGFISSKMDKNDKFMHFLSFLPQGVVQFALKPKHSAPDIKRTAPRERFLGALHPRLGALHLACSIIVPLNDLNFKILTFRKHILKPVSMIFYPIQLLK